MTTLHLGRGANIPVAGAATSLVGCICSLKLHRRCGLRPVADVEPRPNSPCAPFMQFAPTTAARTGRPSGVSIPVSLAHLGHGGHRRRLISAESLKAPSACHHSPSARCRAAGSHHNPAPQVLDAFLGPGGPLAGLRREYPSRIRSTRVAGPPAAPLSGSLTTTVPELIRILRAGEHKANVGLPHDQRVAALSYGLA